MLRILTTGGTIDKVYFDANSEFAIGESLLPELLREANVSGEFAITELMRKDSLELSDDDRLGIQKAVRECAESRVLITHGTDTMAQTANQLRDIDGKTVVLTGSMQPARMRRTDAVFNIGFAWAAASLLPAGVYLAMNGEVFDAGRVRKNRQGQRFESL